MTSDGEIVNKILRAENTHDKEYIVDVHKDIDDKFAEIMANGVEILDTITKPCQVEILSARQFRIILHQGLNRQIRRMSLALGYKVTRLVRTRIMNIRLEGLSAGEYRDLTKSELDTLKQSLTDSRNDHTVYEY